MWLAVLPGAVVPLWQLEQVPVTWVDRTWRAGAQAVDEWQLSQTLAGGARCVALLPVAVVPLWQLAQVPVTPAWLKLAGVQALVEWQSLHCAVVAMWLAGLPVRLGAVVAARAGAGDLGVIDPARRSPGGRCVAALADIGGGQVRRALAGGGGAVVAARAGAGDIGVAEVGRGPGAGRVAVAALRGGGDVVGRLARRLGAVVAARAGAGDLGVIDPARRRPGGRCVAALADIGGGQVRRRSCPCAVVPLWQLAQLPVTPAWLKVAGVQALVEWQLCTRRWWQCGWPACPARCRCGRWSRVA